MNGKSFACSPSREKRAAGGRLMQRCCMRGHGKVPFKKKIQTVGEWSVGFCWIEDQ